MFNYCLSCYFQKANNRLYLFALAFGVLLFLSGCKSAELKALENSASIIQLTTGREISRSLKDKAVVLAKQQYAEVTIKYEPINNYTRRDVYDEIVGILEKNNWKRDAVNVVPDFYSGSLTQGYSKLLVSVGINPDKNQVIVEFVNRSP